MLCLVNLWFVGFEDQQMKTCTIVFWQALNEDIASHQKVIDTLADQVHPLSGAALTNVQEQLAELHERYSGLCRKSADVLRRLTSAVDDHQRYDDATRSNFDRLVDWRNAVAGNSDVVGDVDVLRHKFDTLQAS